MKKLLVLSGKGGTGKTTISAAIIQLAHAKAIADCDVDAPNLHQVMQQTVAPETTLFMGSEKAMVNASACIGCGKCALHCQFDAIHLVGSTAQVNEFSCEGCNVCNLVCPTGAVQLHPDVAGKKTLYHGEGVFSTAELKMGRGNSGKLVTDVKQAMLKTAPPCDLSVMDGSPGIGCPVIASVNGVDLVLIVAEPSKSGISDLKRLVATIETFGIAFAICVNKHDTSPENTLQIELFCAERAIAFAGKIPFDKQAMHAANAGNTIANNSPAGRAVQHIYQFVLALLYKQHKPQTKEKQHENRSIL